MNIILYYKGAYNLYSTIVDAPIYSSALTLDQLRSYIKTELGAQGLRHLPKRLERAHKTGTSSIVSESLENEIYCNRAGPNEAHLSFKEFVEQFLTL